MTGEDYDDYKIKVAMRYALADPLYIEGELRSYIPYGKPSHDLCKKCVDKALKRHLGIEDSDKLSAVAPEMLEALENIAKLRQILSRKSPVREDLHAISAALEVACKTASDAIALATNGEQT